jgi:hydroxyethylthiazole kinase-like uncharacterized protein yjeF
VTVACPQEALFIHAAALTAIMTSVCDGMADLARILGDRRKNALVIGPGLGVGEATCDIALGALAAEIGAPRPRRAIVLDADALTSFAGNATRLAEAIRASQATVVLTPHDGEFRKLFENWRSKGEAGAGGKLDLLQSQSKLERTRAAAALTGAIVVLKGPDTVVADPSGLATIAYDLPPWLATAGSGDVLAGLVGGLLAQGMSPFEAASAAVWMHGAAARHFGPGLIAEDIPENLPAVFRLLM